MQTSNNRRERAQIARAAMETDYATYCNILPDQSISEPLIPSKNALKQLNWRVNVYKGARYQPPENQGIYGLDVKVHYGCFIKGSIFAKENVVLQSGFSVQGRKEEEALPCRIYGNVACMGEVRIVEPSKREKKQYDDWSAPLVDYPLVIKGNVLCDSAVIKAGVMIEGNLIALNRIIIEPGKEKHHFAAISGGVYSLEGRLDLERCFCEFARGFSGITTNGLVGLSIPLLVAEEGEVNINEDVYIVDRLLCQACSGFSDMRRCKEFRKDKCTTLERLNQVDVLPYRKGSIATKSWRTFRDTKRYQISFPEENPDSGPEVGEG